MAQSLPLTATPVDGNGHALPVVPAAMLAVGDRVLIRPGETVPADGVIVVGFSALDESLLCGESNPRDKQAGDRLLGGSINVTQPLQMEVTAVGAHTVMAEIQRSIERAQADKPPLARLADRIAARFISLVLIIVIGVAGYWWLLESDQWFEIALAVLIVSCPCALSLATPTAISATLGKMQAAGLLVRRAMALEKLDQVTHIVFDKTGTLTLGRPVLKRVLCKSASEADDWLAIAASLEQHSAHPLALALLRAADEVGMPRADNGKVSAVISTAGGGLGADIDGIRYHIGNSDFIRRETAAEIPSDWLELIDSEAVTAVILAGSNEALAMFTFVDELRADAFATVAAFRACGKSVVLMTGDRAPVAQQIAGQAMIDDWQAQMTPQAKMDAVQVLQADGAVVLMVGDGINDAPVLAAADVSIAMAGASSLAKINADIVLMRDRLGGIIELIDAATRTRRVIRQNLSWALLYNFGAIPAAAMGMVAPWLAALGMSLSSLLVVVNAMRLTR
jgi:Cu2+-exporting ATPase